MVRIAVVGHSGVGKSTFVSCVQAFYGTQGKSVELIKLAAPLYELQRAFRVVAGADVPLDLQDQLLMEDIARHLRRLNPHVLVNHFLDKVAASAAEIIINDDLRDPHIDAVALRQHGFRIVRIVASDEVRHSRLRLRGDVTTSDASAAEIHHIDAEAEIKNVGSIKQFERSIIRALEEMK